MDRIKKAALITRLIEKMRERGSWCGETHIQKATLFLQYLVGVPTGFDFILYKHGPFSFDLRDELTSLRADDFVKLEPQGPYGPRIASTSRSKYIQDLCSKTIEEYDNRIDFVAEHLGTKGVAELERLATVFFLAQGEHNDASIEKRAERLTKVKPHISKDDAIIAVKEVDKLNSEWSRQEAAAG